MSGWGSGVRRLCGFTALCHPNQNSSQHSQHEAPNKTHNRRLESERDSATYFFSRSVLGGISSVNVCSMPTIVPSRPRTGIATAAPNNTVPP